MSQSSSSDSDKDDSSSLSPSTKSTSSHPSRPTLRDKVSSGLHEYLPGLSVSGHISAKIRNETSLPVQLVSWPRKVHYEAINTDGDDAGLEFSSHRGSWDSEVLPPDTILTPVDGEDVEIGTMKRAHSLQTHTHWGWIALDLVKPDGDAVHLQVYLHLSRNGIKSDTSLGRLDLDSNRDVPQPSGVVGRTEFTKAGDSVTFVITKDLEDLLNTVDDSTKKASRLLAGKGVETTTYVHHAGCRLNLFIGKEARYHEHDSRKIGSLGEMRYTRHEVEGATSKFVGICGQHKGRPFFKAHLKIHPVTGFVDSGQTTLASTLKSKALFSEDNTHVLNYGFSDQGTGRRDQLYAYLTRVHESWLGQLIDEDPTWLEVPFSQLALAGSHDAGMSEALNPGLLFAIQNGTLARGLSSSKLLDLGTPVVRTLVRALESIKFRPERALQNLANTQKDESATQLRVGVRFFDFRPGYNFYDVINCEKKEIRHQHAMVPGEEYVVFLRNIFEFLARNTKEIVVVELKKDGFILPEEKKDKEGQVVAYSMIPTVEELHACLDNAHQSAGSLDISVGNARDLDSTIGELIENRKRLILVDRIHEPESWMRSDSYTHEAYGTDNPATIMAQLIQTHKESSKADETETTPRRGCIYQLQATPTSNIVDAAKSALTFSDASSLLVWMKAQQDRVTYPWISQTDFDDPGLVIFLNDFCDGALVDHTIDVCKRRKEKRSAGH